MLKPPTSGTARVSLDGAVAGGRDRDGDRDAAGVGQRPGSGREPSCLLPARSRSELRSADGSAKAGEAPAPAAPPRPPTRDGGHACARACGAKTLQKGSGGKEGDPGGS